MIFHAFCGTVPSSLSGITQERIDECRGAKEREMLADVQALIDSGGDLSSRDEHEATLVCA